VVVLHVHIRAAVPRVLSPTESVAHVIPNLTDPMGTSMLAEDPEPSSATGGVTGVTYTVRLSTGAGWHPVRSSAPPARRSAKTLRGKGLFLVVLVCAENPRRVNTTKGTLNLGTGTAPRIEETFVYGEPG
jgi:hypothetical protein